MMRKKLKLIIMALALAMPTMANSQKNEKKVFNWEAVINAIIKVESGGNPKARNAKGDCAGVLQITPVLVKECNNILKREKSKKRYTLQDRYNVKKSKEMFIIIQEHLNPEHNVEKAIKCWNCGGFYLKNNGWKNKSIGYYKKVMKNLK
jgi:hypothetical protein